MKRLFISLLSLSLLAGNAAGMQQPLTQELPFANSEIPVDRTNDELDPINSMMDTIQQAMPAYVLNLGSVLIHELGHKIALKLLCNVSSTIHIDNLFPPEAYTEHHYFENGWKAAVAHLAGPAFGVLSTFGLLKIYTLARELFNGKSFKNSIKYAAKTSSFNKQLPLALKLGAQITLANNIANLLPLEYGKEGATDGYYFLEALGIKFALNKFKIRNLFRR